MGYDICSGKSKKAMYEDYDNVLSHISCQYAYQEYFRRAFGCEITNWTGRLYKKDIPNFISGIDNFIKMLKRGISIPMYSGNLSNISQENLIKELEELKELINNGEIGYMSIS